MTPNRITARAFTLIELLVVVLIIGILAAVAVPQYQRAVVKSKFHNLYPVARALAQAQESYFLANQDYAINLAELDISVPTASPTSTTATLDDGTQIKLGAEENHVYVRSEQDNNALVIYQQHSPNFAGETHCEAKLDNTLANWLCKDNLQGTFIGKKYGYNIYALNTTDPNSTLARTYYNTIPTDVLSDGDKCISDQNWGCIVAVSGGTCISEDDWACHNIRVQNGECIVNHGNGGCHAGVYDNSTCTANVSNGCWGGTGRYQNHSSCIGNKIVTCGGNKKFQDHSNCKGNSSYSCYNNSFTDHSYCLAAENYSCTSNTYDATSFCTSANGYCPAGTPKGTWNAATETYELDGWNGGYCNPSSMISGTCPAGSPKQGGGTW